MLNTLRPKQNAYFPDDILKCIFWIANVWILINVSLKSAPGSSISNIPALVQLIYWHRQADRKSVLIKLHKVIFYFKLLFPIDVILTCSKYKYDDTISKGKFLPALCINCRLLFPCNYCEHWVIAIYTLMLAWSWNWKQILVFPSRFVPKCQLGVSGHYGAFGGMILKPQDLFPCSQL